MSTNIFINGIELADRYVSSTQTDKIQQTINLEFVPSVAGEANLLVITTPDGRVFLVKERARIGGELKGVSKNEILIVVKYLVFFQVPNC